MEGATLNVPRLRRRSQPSSLRCPPIGRRSGGREVVNPHLVHDVCRHQYEERLQEANEARPYAEEECRGAGAMVAGRPPHHDGHAPARGLGAIDRDAARERGGSTRLARERAVPVVDVDGSGATRAQGSRITGIMETTRAPSRRVIAEGGRPAASPFQLRHSLRSHAKGGRRGYQRCLPLGRAVPPALGPPPTSSRSRPGRQAPESKRSSLPRCEHRGRLPASLGCRLAQLG